ncbi:hypothetical protein [Hydrogenophaga sp.]|uniref:hypothetical protein n=1 Tax=Hydrogenophaga sp. TaxID=1904254 RepID=UPI00271DACD8|nr:hypothetical protein [Hydrogenophaga sp.]MDO9434740.1 hypothetical protein [Hydrogenophaga sp.]
MFPWLFLWAPQLQLPFSGDVAQRIEPRTQWFFDGIDTASGDPVIERKAFEVATYGRQLGLITELLLDMAEQTPPRTKAGRESRQRLLAIQAEIERIKTEDAAGQVAMVEAGLRRLKTHHKAEYEALRTRLQQALTAP